MILANSMKNKYVSSRFPFNFVETFCGDFWSSFVTRMSCPTNTST